MARELNPTLATQHHNEYSNAMAGQALAVDWTQVRTVAIAIGLREAARQFGISEDAVRQRSCREGWLKELRNRDDSISRAITQKRINQGLSPIVTSASDALANAVREGRAGWKMAASKVGKRLGTLDADELMAPDTSQAAGTWSKVAVAAGVLSPAGEATVRLEILARSSSLAVEQGVIDVESIEDGESGIDSGQIEG